MFEMTAGFAPVREPLTNSVTTATAPLMNKPLDGNNDRTQRLMTPLHALATKRCCEACLIVTFRAVYSLAGPSMAPKKRTPGGKAKGRDNR